MGLDVTAIDDLGGSALRGEVDATLVGWLLPGLPEGSAISLPAFYGA